MRISFFSSCSGNVLFSLFAVIALVGAFGAASMVVLKGPVTGMQKVTKYKSAENDMIAAAIMISRQSLTQANADCDGDGTIEPLPFAIGADSAPAGGGLIPATVGVRRMDPWGGAYGYCVWDHGVQIKAAGCGGAPANRLAGSSAAIDDATAIAVISAGPDRIFQTSCSGVAPTVNKPTNSDDLIRLTTYKAFISPPGTGMKLEELPDEACTPQTIGIMRVELGVVQICVDTGWTEVGTSASSNTEFLSVINAPLNSPQTSNAISFSGFLGTKKLIVVQGNATLIINGNPAGTTAQIAAGDTVALQANAAATPETTLTFRISVSGVHKTWTIRTRDYLPAQLSISPASHSMTISTPGNPGYGNPTGFIVSNTGEMATGPMLASQLSNITNFQFHSGGGFAGDGCAMKDLAGGQTCSIDIRPRASDDGTYSGTLTARAAATTAQASLSLTASGWSCPIPWGGTTAHNTSITAYQAASVPFGDTCQSQSRECNLGELSGSFMHPNCAPAAAANCASAPGGALSHGQTRRYYVASTVPYGGTCSYEDRTCYNGSLPGSYTATSCNIGAAANCTSAPGGTLNHGQTRRYYVASSVPCGGTCSYEDRTCNNGILPGSYSATSCEVASCAPVCGAMVSNTGCTGGTVVWADAGNTVEQCRTKCQQRNQIGCCMRKSNGKTYGCSFQTGGTLHSSNGNASTLCQ